MKNDIKNYTLEELTSFLKERGYPHFYAQQIFSWIYKRRIDRFEAMTDISKEARAFLKEHFYCSQLTCLGQARADDGTEKFLFQLNDHSLIETVCIPEVRRNTLCLSTQVGCKFRCGFCVSGKTGFRRNLLPQEIINQYHAVQSLGASLPITNIVFMGIGEPLDNFNNVVKTIRILREPKGAYFGRGKICISTIGIPSKIYLLKRLNLGIKLSLSLHAPDPHKRQQLMPRTKNYPFGEVIDAVRAFASGEKNLVTFEYILIKGFNTSAHDAVTLARLVRGIKCKVNLIPYNPSPYFRWQVPELEEINEFNKILKKYHVFSTLRKARGSDIQASCGQLKAEFRR